MRVSRDNVSKSSRRFDGDVDQGIQEKIFVEKITSFVNESKIRKKVSQKTTREKF